MIKIFAVVIAIQRRSNGSFNATNIFRRDFHCI